MEDRGISEGKVDSERLERRRSAGRRVGCQINELVDVELEICDATGEKKGGGGRVGGIMLPVALQPLWERKKWLWRK